MTRRLLLLAASALVAGCTTTRLGPVATGTQPDAASADAVAAGARLFPARLGSRWGYVGPSGGVAIEARFDHAQPFSEGRAGVRVGSEWGYIDPTGAFVSVPVYAAAFPFEGGRARVVAGTGTEARMGFVGSDGAPTVEPSLLEAFDYGPDGHAPARAEAARIPLGLSVFESLGLVGSGRTPWLVLDAGGAVVAEVPAVTVLSFGDAGGRALAPFRTSSVVPGVDGRWGYVDAAGAIAIEPQFRGASVFSEGLARVSDRSRFGFVDASGRLVVPMQYAQADAFSEGLAAVRDGDLWGFIRPDGTVAIAPRYEAALAFSNGLAAVSEGGRWGYVRPDGETIIAPRFEEASSFRGALAHVVENGRAAYVDASGTVVWREAP